MEPVRRSSANVPEEVRQNAVTSLREFSGIATARAAHVGLIADQIGVSERTIWRWLEIAEGEGRSKRRERPRLQVTEQDIHDLAYHRGNIAAFLRARAASESTAGYDTWRRAFAEVLSRGRRAGLRYGERARRDLDTYLTRNPQYRNECWEADHTQLALKVVLPDRRVVSPWITLFVDAFTRAIMGYAVTAVPSRESILAALRAAIMTEPPYGPFGGVPVAMRFDRGRDFLAEAIRVSAGALGIEVRPLPGYTPHLKGTVERTNETIEQIFLAELPGFTHGPKGKNGKLFDLELPLLQLGHLVELFEKFTVLYNTKRPHQSLDGETPLQRWEGDSTPIHSVPGERLRHLLLASAKRVVSKRGIRFDGRTYNCAELCGYVGETVEVRYMPNHHDSVEVFIRDKHLATALLVDRLSRTEAKRLIQHRADDARWLAREQRNATKRRQMMYAAMTEPGAVVQTTAFSEEGTAVERAYHGDAEKRRLASRSLVNHGKIPERMIQPSPPSRSSQ